MTIFTLIQTKVEETRLDFGNTKSEQKKITRSEKKVTRTEMIDHILSSIQSIFLELNPKISNHEINKFLNFMATIYNTHFPNNEDNEPVQIMFIQYENLPDISIDERITDIPYFKDYIQMYKDLKERYLELNDEDEIIKKIKEKLDFCIMDKLSSGLTKKNVYDKAFLSILRKSMKTLLDEDSNSTINELYEFIYPKLLNSFSNISESTNISKKNNTIFNIIESF